MLLREDDENSTQ